MVDLPVRKTLPDGFLSCRADELQPLLGGPCLIHLRGRTQQAVVVSILLHGNEVSGLTVVQNLLQQSTTMPRDLLIFVGNTRAAAAGLRRLDGQPDYNRIWAGGELKEHLMAQQVLDYAASCNPVAAVDIHNNTGRNPLYACINHVDRRFLRLARSFSDTIVFFSEPHQIFANNMARYCPAVTLECGQPGDRLGIERAVDTLEYCLHSEISAVANDDIDKVKLFHTVARMIVPPDSRIAFDQIQNLDLANADFVFPEGFDAWNFQPLPVGTHFGVALSADKRLCVRNDAGRDITENYFSLENGVMKTRKTFSPTMLTLDERVMVQDCVGYIMERYPHDGAH
ncbi:M14 family metallopeptidase [Litorivivens sp.]|uniref:M14 family metallopeptidase n=1 Tax=Litorivivens sp. TaxID=2020868 RepID=UPI0035668DFB